MPETAYIAPADKESAVVSPPEKIGVCLSGGAADMQLLESARQQAEEQHAAWIAIHIEPLDSLPDSATQQCIQYSLALASSLGAETVRMPSTNVVEGITTAVELYGITTLVIGEPERHRIIKQLCRQEIAGRLQQKDVGCKIVREYIGHTPTAYAARQKTTGWRRWIASLALILLLTLGVELIQESLPEYRFNASIYNVSMLYMLVIAFCSLRYGLWPAMACALLSFGLYNFFFIPPFYAFGLNQLSDIINFLLFLSASLVSVIVARNYQHRNQELQFREQAASALYILSKDIAGSSDIETIHSQLQQHLSEILQGEVVLWLDGTPPPQALPTLLVETLKAPQSAPVTIGEWLAQPLQTAERHLGFLIIRRGLHPLQQANLFEALCYQTALAIERARLMSEAADVKLQHQRESVRSALLSSVSHDLKTPLVSIIGALSSLRHMQDALSAEEKQALLATANEEAARLNHIISNILDMTRLESGAIKINKALISVETLYRDSVQRLSTALENHPVTLNLPENSVFIDVDSVLFGQLLQNLLENAANYTPPGTVIRLSARIENDFVLLNIADSGPGIDAANHQRLFDRFARLEQKDRKTAGTGLGLTICKAIMTLHGGTISLGSNPEGPGLNVQMALPAPPQPQQEQE